jgi:RNA polymerase sigma factor (sigma-70 family)
MSDQQLHKLVIRAQAGDDKASTALFKRYEPTLRRLAQKRLTRNGDIDDLFSDACLIFLTALKNYDPNISPQFGAYLNKCVYQSLMRSQQTDIRVPAHYWGYKRTIEQAMADYGTNDPNELARLCHMRPSTVVGILAYSPYTLSLDAPLGESDCTLADAVSYDMPDNDYLHLHEQLRRLVRYLPDDQKAILKLRLEGYSIREVADQLGLHHTTIHAKERKAKIALKQKLEKYERKTRC